MRISDSGHQAGIIHPNQSTAQITRTTRRQDRAMTTYSRILVAVDLKDTSATVMRRAQALAAACGAQLHLLQVVEYVPVSPLGENTLPPTELIGELMNAARQQLTTLAIQLGLPVERCSVAIGGVKTELVRTVHELGCDLIVLGSHERHGLSVFLNFTEDSMLHAAPCDMLAVRVGET
jgi:universal stress protein A